MRSNFALISCIGSHDLLYWVTWSLVLGHMISHIGSHDLLYWITWSLVLGHRSLVLDHMISCIGSHDLLYLITRFLCTVKAKPLPPDESSECDTEDEIRRWGTRRVPEMNTAVQTSGSTLTCVTQIEHCKAQSLYMIKLFGLEVGFWLRYFTSLFSCPKALISHAAYTNNKVWFPQNMWCQRPISVHFQPQGWEGSRTLGF